MPRSTKNAKAPSAKKAKQQQKQQHVAPAVKPVKMPKSTRLQYSSDAVDYRFGVLMVSDEKDYACQGHKFSGLQLQDVCLNQMGMKAVAARTSTDTRRSRCPKLVVVPDRQTQAVKKAMQQLAVKHKHVHWLTFSSLVSLLMRRNQMDLLSCLGLTHAEAVRFVDNLPAFCLSGSVHFMNYFLSHAFIRDGLHRMGFKVHEECSLNNKKAVVVGDVQHASKYGEHVTHLNVFDFFALQPHSDLHRLHELMKAAFQALPVQNEHKAPSKKSEKEAAPTKKPAKAASKKKPSAKKPKKAASKPTKVPAKQSKKKIKGGDEIKEEELQSQDEEEDHVNEEVEEEPIVEPATQKRIGRIRYQKSRLVDEETGEDVGEEIEIEEEEENDDEPISWVL